MAKVSREQAQQNRERVIETGARLFRERGFDGVGIADVMKAAGLTHGGFYAQFPSKEHLMAEAAGKAATALDRTWRERLEKSPRKSLSVLASEYLTPEHRDDPGTGCVLAALGGDASRQTALVRSTFTESVKNFFHLVTGLMPSRSAKAKRREAIATCAAMVGALVLARSVDDESLSNEILDTVSKHIAAID